MPDDPPCDLGHLRARNGGGGEIGPAYAGRRGQGDATRSAIPESIRPLGRTPKATSRSALQVTSTTDVRAAFIRRTYLHLFGAIVAFIALEAALLTSPVAEKLAVALGTNWWMVLLAMMAVSWVAEKWAHSDTSQGMQYMGLALYVAAEAVIFVPLL